MPRPEDLHFLKVFFGLASSRPAGDSIGAIPESEFEAYFNNRMIPPGEERHRTIQMVRKLDEVFLAHAEKKRKEALDRAKAMNKSRPPARH